MSDLEDRLQLLEDRLQDLEQHVLKLPLLNVPPRRETRYWLFASAVLLALTVVLASAPQKLAYKGVLYETSGVDWPELGTAIAALSSAGIAWQKHQDDKRNQGVR